MTVASNPWAWRPERPSRLVETVGLMRLTGPDSLRVLHGQTSQALEGARAGQCLATCSIGPTARLRALAEVLVEEDGAWLVVTAGDGSDVHRALDRVLFPADRVELGAVVEARLVTPVAPTETGDGRPPAEPLPASEPGTWQRYASGGDQGWLLGSRLLWPAGSPLPAPWSELVPLEPTEQELWRLRHGHPAVPGEISGETNPFELGLAGRVSLSKGCYVGQETLAKLSTYDGVKQQLRRWVWSPSASGGAGPQDTLIPGAPLTTAAGERAGRITSALALPGDGAHPGPWVGLALVRRVALGEESLVAGEGFAVRISRPDGFAEPPGAGSGR